MIDADTGKNFGGNLELREIRECLFATEIILYGSFDPFGNESKNSYSGGPQYLVFRGRKFGDLILSCEMIEIYDKEEIGIFQFELCEKFGSDFETKLIELIKPGMISSINKYLYGESGITVESGFCIINESGQEFIFLPSGRPTYISVSSSVSLPFDSAPECPLGEYEKVGFLRRREPQ